MCQSKVPHEEIGIRLSICSEFLLDEKKPIEDAYESLIGKIGRKIIEYTEFEYWFKRFKNDLFDLGHDTNLDSNENSGTPDDFQLKINNGPDEISEKKNSRTIHLGFDICLDTDEIAGFPTQINIKASEARIVPGVTTIDHKVAPKPLKDVVFEKKNPKTVNIPSQIAYKNIVHQFNETNLPEVFQTLINENMSSISSATMSIGDSCCWMDFSELNIRFEKKSKKDWALKYHKKNTKVKTSDPEKFIVDHLWFVLRNPNIQLTMLMIDKYSSTSELMDFGKLNSQLQLMFNSFDHHIHTTRLHTQFFNVDTFCTILKHVKPGTLEEISFEISEIGSCQKMKEIAELEQWKQAKMICSPQMTLLTIDDILHFKSITFSCIGVTPEDVVRIRDHFLKSPNSESCTLTAVKHRLNFDEIEKTLRLGNLYPEKNPFTDEFKYCYQIPNSEKFLYLTLNDNKVSFKKS